MADDVDVELPELAEKSDDDRAVYKHRYAEARDAGLSIVEAQMFADSDTSVSILRRLVAGGCGHRLMVKIVL